MNSSSGRTGSGGGGFRCDPVVGRCGGGLLKLGEAFLQIVR